MKDILDFLYRRRGTEIPKIKYTERLSGEDARNLTELEVQVQKALESQTRGGALIAVGSSLNKNKWNDIDVLMILEEHEGDISASEFQTPYEYAIYDFRLLTDIVKDAVGNSDILRIDSITEPAIDHDHEPNLRHDGSILLSSSEGGSPIEVIRESTRGISKVIPMMPKDFSILLKYKSLYG